MNDRILHCEDLTRVYGTGARCVRALGDVRLTVERGEIVAVMGPSGSGKTTLLSLLGGLLVPSAGRLWVDGQELSGLTVARRRAALKGRVGFVFQRFLLLPELTAWENVALGFRLAGIRWKSAATGARALLVRLGLADRLDARPAALSAGEQQRVGLARGLGFGPTLLLADEPTGNLDWHTGQTVMQVLIELAAQHNTTVILATHDERVVGYASRLVRLADGRLVEDRALRSIA